MPPDDRPEPQAEAQAEPQKVPCSADPIEMSEYLRGIGDVSASVQAVNGMVNVKLSNLTVSPGFASQLAGAITTAIDQASAQAEAGCAQG